MTEHHETVYNQYWSHARHSEKQVLSLTSINSAIIAAIFAAIGGGLPVNMLVSVSIFGFIISMLGFLLVFTLRLSFIRYVCMAEVIAINELGLKDEYRRFYTSTHKRLMPDKPISEPDILSVFYSLIGAIMISFSLNLFFGEGFFNYLIGIITLVVLFLIHWFVCRKKYEKVWSEIKKNIKN